MKKKDFIKNIALGGMLTLCAGLTSCDDFLTIYPTNEIVEEKFWEDRRDLDNVVRACYRRMIQSDMLEKYILWGEVRSDNFVLASGENSQSLINLMQANLLPTQGFFNWQPFYQTINWCNKVLEHGQQVVDKDPSFSQSEWRTIEIEMKTLRALNHFYLIRSFGEVPVMLHAINDDSQEMKFPQTSQEKALTLFIDELEDIQGDACAPVEYPKIEDDKGRITQKAIWSLLADMYLWRAAKNSSTDSIAKYPGEAAADYQKCSDYCDKVIDRMRTEYIKYYNEHNTTGLKLDEDELVYPLIENEKTDLSIESYEKIFGEQNSTESIFELQMDNTNNVNHVVNNYYNQISGTKTKFNVSTVVSDAASAVDADDRCFYKTDLRRWQCAFGGDKEQYRIAKYTVNSITVVDAKDNTKQQNNFYASTSSNVVVSNNDAYNGSNWIVYRLTDVMLMKAEALAGLCTLNGDNQAMLDKGLQLTQAVYLRSNPWAVGTVDTLKAPSSGSDLEKMVIKERQRELYGEGKRWYDLVRYAMKRGSTSEMLEKFLTRKYESPKAIEAKLADMRSLYLPIYNEEIKRNGLLIQNPIWTLNETTSKTDKLN